MKKITFLFFLLPITLFGQLSDSLEVMKADKNVNYKNYEKLLFRATNYIFENPVDLKSQEFISATQIVNFWMNKETEMGIPTFGNFFKSLTNDDKQQFLYIVAMINYGLNQKINYNRNLECKPKKGEKYSEQVDVKEVQIEGAKIVLKYIGNKNNNVKISSQSKKYLKAYENGNLEEIFFE